MSDPYQLAREGSTWILRRMRRGNDVPNGPGTGVCKGDLQCNNSTLISREVYYGVSLLLSSSSRMYSTSKPLMSVANEGVTLISLVKYRGTPTR